MRHQLSQWARAIRRDTVTLYLAARDPRVPWHAKLLALLVTAYAVSPIDLIPDFIPVVGYLDDLVILPLGMLLARKLIPRDVVAELREEAAKRTADLPASRTAAAVVLAFWLAAGACIAYRIAAG